MQDTIMSVIRHYAQVGAGALVMKGVIDGSVEEAAVGLAVNAAILGWFLFNKYVLKKS